MENLADKRMTEFRASRLFDLLVEGKSPFHVVKRAKERLSEAGFVELSYVGEWKLKKGGNYYIDHHGSTLFAIHVGEAYEPGKPCRLAAAHTDFPCLRVKPNPEIHAGGYAQLNVEVYGGPILNTWLDRPLSIAGRVALKSKDVQKPDMRLFVSRDSVVTIPNLAIHMNREVNKGVELNRQTDLLPVAAVLAQECGEEQRFLEYLGRELGVDAEEILDYELSVVSSEEPCTTGYGQELVSSPRLDNLTSVQALLWGICHCRYREGISVAAFFDHEEIGSRTKQGAGSLVLRDLLEKLHLCLGAAGLQCKDSLYQSLLLSVDVAHALHPNQMGKMDPTNRPVLNHGICIKEACAQSYATDSEAVAMIQQLCMESEIPYQKFVNRSDMPGGGTLGSIASSILPVRTVDIGLPVLAMHSIRELMGHKDQEALERLLEAYFGECGGSHV